MAFPTDAVGYIWGDTGSDGNGGFFSASLSTPGTSVDYSQQSAPQATATTALTTPAAGSTTLNWPGGSFTAAMVGNAVQITAGTGFQTGFYFITAVASATSVTLDRTPSSGAAGSAGTGRVGGALATIGKAVNTNGGVIAYVRKGTTNYPGNITPAAGSSGQPTVIQGYNATVGDAIGDPTYANCAVVQVATAIAGFSITGQRVIIRGIIVDGNNVGTTGISVSAANVVVEWCYAKRWVTRGFFASVAGVPFRSCLATDMTAAAGAGFTSSGQGVSYEYCTADRNACPGFVTTAGKGIYYRCISRNNTGTTSDGYQLVAGLLQHCVADSNGRDGLRAAGAGAGDNLQYNNCAFRGNGVSAAGYGVNSDTTVYSYMSADYNSFYNNATGARNNVPAGAHDVVPAADPYVDAANGNYALNDAPAAGGALTGAGGPAVFPYVSAAATTTGTDIGVYQSSRFGTADPIYGGIIT